MTGSPLANGRSARIGSTSSEAISLAGASGSRSPAGLAVDADAELHLALAEVERRLARSRHGAGRERHAHAAAVRVDGASDLGDLVEVATLLRGRAGDLLEQHGDADPAAPRGPGAVLDGHVVVGDHRDDAGAGLRRRQLGRHLEVHHVAGVVLHDVQDPRAAVHQLGGGQHLLGHRRGEHLSGARRVEHAQADESAVERLVPRATAGDDAHLVLLGGATAVDDLVVVVDLQVGVSCFDPAQCLDHDVVRVVDQLLHESPFPGPGGGRSDVAGRACGRRLEVGIAEVHAGDGLGSVGGGARQDAVEEGRERRRRGARRPGRPAAGPTSRRRRRAAGRTSDRRCERG